MKRTALDVNSRFCQQVISPILRVKRKFGRACEVVEMASSAYENWSSQLRPWVTEYEDNHLGCSCMQN